MEFFRIHRDIPFMRHALTFNVISAVTFVLAVFFLATRGLNLGVDFRGGTVIEVTYDHAADFERIRDIVDKNISGEASVQSFGTSTTALIRLPLKDDYSNSPINACLTEKAAQNRTEGKPAAGSSAANLSNCLVAALQADDATARQQRVEFVGPQVGKELFENGALALLLVSLGIMGYLALRFEWRFAVAAIIANLHDIIIILGFFALFQWEFSLPVLAAVLAVLGYSVNESVVIADRIRENFRKMRKATVTHVIDNAITSTISRTIITHGMTLMMVLSILFFGGETLHYFALALTIGICFGIYSSVLVMAPIVMWLGVSREDLVKPERAGGGEKILP
jgi:preprotein translocase subunit SecF